MEDSEELASSQRASDSMRDNFHKQVGHLSATDNCTFGGGDGDDDSGGQ